MFQPLVSIIVPCYNQGLFLTAALKSIIFQSYPHWECIIVDDGSSDNTEEIARKFCMCDGRIKYFKKSNGGLSSARNYGINEASGEYIQFLDSDDLLEKNKIKQAIESYQTLGIQDSSKIIIYSGMRYFENSNPEILKILGRDQFIGHVDLNRFDLNISQTELLQARNLCVISAPIYPITVFQSLRFDEQLHALEDWDFNLRCAKTAYIFHYAYFKNANTLIRLHDQSMMRDQKLLDENFSKFNLKHNLRIEKTSKKRKSREIIKMFLPPIVLKIFRVIFPFSPSA